MGHFRFLGSAGAGSAGPAGPAGPAGITWRGPWSAATAYAVHDGVTWQGSSFVALNAVAAGGANPNADAVNWLQVASGSGELAYAQIVAQVGLGVAAALTDIAGLQINVPAGSPAHEVELFLPGVQFAFSATAVAGDQGNVRFCILDETGAILSDVPWQLYAAKASAQYIQGFSLKRRMAAQAGAKTYKASWYITSLLAGHISGLTLFAGPGAGVGAAGAGSTDVGPAFIRARSA